MQSTRLRSELIPVGKPTPIVAPHSRHAHSVQFYEDEAFLYGVVADFLIAGMSNGQPALVLAAKARHEGLLAALSRRYPELGDRVQTGQFTILDAEGVLDLFMADGFPVESAFDAVLDEILDRLTGGGQGLEVCVHGEMVDMLWKAGNSKAAIRLEELWNRLAERHAFSLLCTYGIRNFSSASDAEGFLEVCRQHEHVLPTERFIDLDDAARLGEISALQQRAQALEAEIQSRCEVEHRLRDVLAEQAELLRREQAARREAEEANQAKRDFLAVMSHELRTPLNAIAGYTELIELGVHGPVSERQRECLERIQLSQQRLLGLIDEVLIYSRIEAGKVRYRMDEVPMQEVLRAAELGVLPQLHGKEIDYTCALRDTSLVIRTDRERLQQILMNLLANAIKFSEHGGKVQVLCVAAEPDVLVHVRDAGRGIPKDKLDAIFQPFFQVNAGLTREHQGAGLGLSISRQFARGMGGDIMAKSVTGEGTTFTLRLPICPPRCEAADLVSSSSDTLLFRPCSEST